MSYWPIYIFG